MKKILITGAAGDIGTRLVKALAKRDDVDLYTTALTDLPYSVSSTHRNFDVRDPMFLQWVKQVKPDVVVHLASIIRLPATMSESEAYEIDVTATERLLALCADIGVGKFVVTSSGAAYGYWPDNPDWIDETNPVRGNDDYFYSRHKRLVEELLAGYRERCPHLKQVVLRPGTVLGPDFENPITNMFEKKRILGIRGSQSPFVIIWVDDLVNYLIEASVSELEGVFNVAGDGVLTMPQIAKRLNKPYLSIPALVVKSLLAILKPLGLSQYGPEQVKFIQYRPVLANKKIKSVFKHQPEKTTAEAFESFLAQSKKEYMQS